LEGFVLGLTKETRQHISDKSSRIMNFETITQRCP
jgi:hypothetical protein